MGIVIQIPSNAPKMTDFEAFFLKILAQLAIIILAARLGGWIAAKWGQPIVVGEIAAGLVLGPSLLGRVWPDGLSMIFSTDTSLTLHAFSELGLVFLMFLVGLEFDFTLLRQVGTTSLRVAVAGLVLPLAMGLALAAMTQPLLAAEVDRLSFMLIVAVAMSITAIPILGRIMIELNMHKTHLGVLTITAAAIDDVGGWLLLAGISGVLHGHFSLFNSTMMFLMLIVFCLAVIFVVRPGLMKGVPDMNLKEEFAEIEPATLSQFSLVLSLVLLSAMATNAIGIFSVFGPFILGAAFSDKRWFHQNMVGPLRPVVYSLFLPVFFTYTGLRTDIGTLATLSDWLMLVIFLLVAVGGKCGGCFIAARYSGLPWRQSACVAVMMNTRALMGLIAINIGRDLGVVPDRVFSILVLVALLTTVMTMPLLRRLLPPIEAQPI